MPRDLSTGRFIAGVRTSEIAATCAVCGRPFLTRRAVVKAGFGRYCGHRCAGLARRRRVDRTCETCGTSFVVCEVFVRNGAGKFCSHACYAESLRHRPRPSPIERLWARVETTATCWRWTGWTDRRGYGYVSGGHFGATPLAAHRLAWEAATDQPVPEGMRVLHVCDIPCCVRNDEPGVYYIRGILRPRFGHLFLGTQADNVADMIEKGRHRPGGKRQEPRRPAHVASIHSTSMRA